MVQMKPEWKIMLGFVVTYVVLNSINVYLTFHNTENSMLEMIQQSWPVYIAQAAFFGMLLSTAHLLFWRQSRHSIPMTTFIMCGVFFLYRFLLIVLSTISKDRFPEGLYSGVSVFSNSWDMVLTPWIVLALLSQPIREWTGSQHPAEAQ